MTEENKDINNLSDLSKLNQTEESSSIEREPKVDKLGRSYSTGRRKESTARVWVKRGTGKITINGKDMPLYLSLIHISEPTRRTPISYAVFCLKKQRSEA